MAANRAIVKLAHHEQQELCVTRPTYRQGRKLTAVKVYTVNNESQHLMICGVPKLQLSEEIRRLASPYGDVKKVSLVPEYPTEEFTEAYHVHYGRIQSARIAKRFIDGKNFYGGLLHVFYAPELESISETRAKLLQRRRDIAIRIKRNQEDLANPETDSFTPKNQYHRKKKTPALPLTEDRLSQIYPGESLTSIYDGIPRSIDPRPVAEPSIPQNCPLPHSSKSLPDQEQLFAPYQPNDAVLIATSTRSSGNISSRSATVKHKNYKGQNIKERRFVKLTRPYIIDTRNMAKITTPSQNSIEDKTVFINIKKVESSIKIKLLPEEQKSKKRIVLKNPNTSSLLQPSPDLQSSISSAKSQIRKAMKKN
ncbi:RNA-binding protein 48 isoform X1 [Neodiprion pinetum]|uniref:RNA-binding protein 48 n=2 Tax=Neodiprion lecontei TaxID=441921 RepID=A0A6J0BSQ1_NEOLC|nr:RNA-binding protein 48 isoform X1 [Neodiprion lecontei]XP_046476225.1 RNA-binding protein 48 isoform X1 [Neodiprion pinetum]